MLPRVKDMQSPEAITAELRTVELYNSEYVGFIAQSPDIETPTTTFVSVGDFTARAGCTTQTINVNQAITAQQASDWVGLYLGYGSEMKLIDTVTSGLAGAASIHVSSAFSGTPTATEVVFTPRVEQRDSEAVSAGNFKVRTNIYGEANNEIIFNSADNAKNFIINYNGVGTVVGANYFNKIIDKVEESSPDFYVVETNATGNLSNGTPPYIKFSSEPLPGAINTTNFKIKDNVNADVADVTPSLEADNVTVTLTPATPLTAGETFSLFVDKDLQAVNGKHLSDYTSADLLYPFTSTNDAPTAEDVEITGTLTIGQTVTGAYTFTDADGDSEGTSTFKWYRGDSPTGSDKVEIAGETGETYLLAAADENKYITFEVTPVAATGTTDGTPVTFTTLTAIIDNAAPVASGVTVSGTTNIGDTLTGTYTYTDAEDDPEGTSTFRWLRDDVAIGGATAETYVLVSADIDKTIKFEVTPVATSGALTGSAVTSTGTVIGQLWASESDTVAHWRFNEAAGTTVVNSKNPGTHDLTVSNTTVVSGDYGNTRRFADVYSHTLTGDYDSSNATISGVADTTAVNVGDKAMISKGSSGKTGTLYSLVEVQSKTSTSLTFTAAPNSGTWPSGSEIYISRAIAVGPNSADLNIGTGDFTFEIYGKWEKTNRNQYMFTMFDSQYSVSNMQCYIKGTLNNLLNIDIYTRDAGGTRNADNGWTTAEIADTNVFDGNYHTIKVVRDTATKTTKCYIDGSLKGTKDWSAVNSGAVVNMNSTNGGKVAIGGIYNGSYASDKPYGFTAMGNIDEVRISSAAK